MVEFLLLSGAEPNVVEVNTGETPLHSAVLLAADLNLVILLVQHGANINSTSFFGKTPLHCAVGINDEIVTYLEKTRRNHSCS